LKAIPESVVLKRVMLTASKLKCRLMRNNRGMFYTMDGRKVMAGLSAAGSSDLIGWHRITVTPEMVGREIAVFLAVEVKRKGGRSSDDQDKFIEIVNESGGIAFICDDEKKIKKELDLRFS